MGNEAHLLAPDVAAAAAAIANNRNARTACGGLAAVDNILDILPEKLFAEVVEDARAALKAGAGAAGQAGATSLRPRGPLNAADASALGLELGAGTLLIFARDRASRARAAIWAAGVSASVLDHDEAQQFWAAFAGVARTLPEAQPA